MTDPQLELPPLSPSEGRRAEQVMATIRSAIDNGAMRTGVKYSAYQLSDALGVSRTPVRDALLRLEEIGLIRFEARQGFRILLPDPKEIAEIFAIRLALELPAVARSAVVCDASLAARLHHRMELLHAAATAGDEHIFAQHDLLLHDHILEAAGNMRAREIVRSLRESTRLLGATTADRTRNLFDIDAEHRPVVTAITANQPAEAADTMRRHLTSTGQLLVSQAIRDQGSELDGAAVWAAAVDQQHV
jgi:DNA-binding GntR family transcriptional regulator